MDELPASELPLLGLRVAEAVSGPMRLAGRLLADLGAHVTRRGLPGSPPRERTHRTAAGSDLDAERLNRGKLRLSADGQALRDLLAAADILIEDGAGALDMAALRGRRPELVVVSVSDFGAGTSHAAWRATDPVLHAMSG